MPKAIESAITKLLKLSEQLSPAERQAAIDILRHANRRESPKPPPAKRMARTQREPNPRNAAIAGNSPE